MDYNPPQRIQQIPGVDCTIEDENDENAGYMEQEEIVIKKGKKLKQMKQIKLREYNI